MRKVKNMKKFINSKLLYTFPLAGAGLFFSQQSAHAMFNPPRKQPAVQHFNGASSTSTNRPLTSPTSPFTSRRPLSTPTSSNRPLSTTNTGASSQTSKSSPFKTSGSKVSGIVAIFESLSSSSSDLKSGTRSPQKLDTKSWSSSSPSSSSSKPAPTSSSDTKQTPTPDYGYSGTKPKTSSPDTKTKPTYKSTLNINLGPKTTTTSSSSRAETTTKPISTTQTSGSDTKPTPTPDYTSLGAKPKTTTTSSTSYSKDIPKPSTQSKKVVGGIDDIIESALKFSDEVKEITQNAFKRELYNELGIATGKISSRFRTFDRTLAHFGESINSISRNTFKEEARKELVRFKVPSGSQIEQRLYTEAKNFGDRMEKMAIDKFKSRALSFSNVKVDEKDLDIIHKQIEFSSEQLGSSIAKEARDALTFLSHDFAMKS